MFESLFEKAEASVENRLGELGNRVLIGIPFIAALGFAAASFSSYANRNYGPEIGNLIVAGGFVLLGFVVALVVKLRKRPIGASFEAKEEPKTEEPSKTGPSFLEDDKVMSIVSAAAPIVLPAMLRTASKNWPLILAAAAGLYVVSRSESAGSTPQSPPQA
ncbi:hypothetical protein [Hyphomicrobium sp.]|uniref:hypothetical protein n=1 Tax=Hyphomicrobium sp. TaxID=82 RepID=UPI001D47B0CD|nr:hypothetical protein [Hyphomicrobium sp.]MBY0559756.1 hypothetical protein [Hyphomicrobium sp.]